MKAHKGKIIFVLIVIMLGLLGWWYYIHELSVSLNPSISPPAQSASTNKPASVSATTLTATSAPSTAQKILGVGNLPAPPLSGVPFSKKLLFGYDNPEALMTALHAKTLRTLSEGQNLKASILQYALQAYACAQAEGKAATQRYLTIIDFSLPDTVKRFWVIDLHDGSVKFHTLVAHGRNSGYIMTDHFSNTPNSRASSLGLFVTENTYIGHDGYSLKLDGLEPGFNDNAEARDVVIHGAAYVSDDFVKKYHYLGRSWGCPALSKAVSTPVINQIKDGSLVFAYYPDPAWLKHSTFLHCKTPLPWAW